MKENRTKGLSMIELIIVIGIIGIMTAFATITMAYVQSGNIRSAAMSINSNLSQLKYDAMSKEEMPFMYIYKANGKYYMYSSKKKAAPSDLTAANGSEICNSNCKITYNGGTAVDTGSYIEIAYKKSGGLSSQSNLSSGISDITVSKADGSGKRYVITIYTETGKHTMTNASS